MVKKTAAIFLVLLAAWFAGLAAFNHKINAYPQDGDGAGGAGQKTDAIVALTGGRNRIREAVRLLDAGLAEKLLISGVEKDISLDEIFRQGGYDVLAKDNIILENQSVNTVENAVNTVDWINESRVRSIRLVTSNYHIPRALCEFRRRAPGLEIVVHPVYSEKVAAGLFSGWGSFKLVAGEYVKFLYAYIRSLLWP